MGNIFSFFVEHAMHSLLLPYSLAIMGGILAGIINTLAGSGSLVTLPILTMLGLPAPEANATNRVGVVFQCAVGSVGFKRKGLLTLDRTTLWWVLPTLCGSLIGASIAVEVEERAMNLFIGAVMVLMLAVTLKDKSAWLELPDVNTSRPSASLMLTMFIVGIYGGFIQAGVGVMLLITLVSGAGFTVARANGLKMIIALGLASAALALFMWHDMINWPLGLLMATGQSIGAWLGVKFLSDFPGAQRWVRRLLILIIMFGIVRFLGPELINLFHTSP